MFHWSGFIGGFDPDSACGDEEAKGLLTLHQSRSLLKSVFICSGGQKPPQEVIDWGVWASPRIEDSQSWVSFAGREPVGTVLLFFYPPNKSAHFHTNVISQHTLMYVLSSDVAKADLQIKRDTLFLL